MKMKQQRGRVSRKTEATRGSTRRRKSATGADGSVELLQELRLRRQVTQEELAEVLGVRQATLSKLERRENVTVATLRNFVEALGGELEVRARFSDETIAIDLPYDPAPVSR